MDAMDGLALAASADLNATGPFALKEHALGMSVGDDSEVGTRTDRVKVSTGSAPASAVALRELVVTATCLVDAVKIWVTGYACLVHGVPSETV